MFDFWDPIFPKCAWEQKQKNTELVKQVEDEAMLNGFTVIALGKHYLFLEHPQSYTRPSQFLF